MDDGTLARGPASTRTRLLLALLVAALCAGAWFLRTRALEGELPERPWADEEVFVHHLQILRGELDVGQDDYRQGIYPRFVPWLASRFPRGAASASPLESSGAEHVLLRRVCALLSLGSVLATWWIARRFLDPFGAAVATALCGGSALFAWYAPQARPHAAEGGLAPLALCACLALAERGSLARYLLAGVCIALALAALQFGALLFAPLVLAHVFASGPRAWRSSWKLLFALVPMALAVRLSYPFLFWEHGAADQGPIGLVPLGLGLVRPVGFWRLFSGLWDFEPWLLLLALSALAWLAGSRALRGELAASRARRAALVLAIWALPFLVLFGLYRHTTQRYALSLVPLLALVAAWLACRMGERIAPGRRSAWLLPLALVGVQACGAWRLGELRSRPDTQVLAQQWIERDLAPGSRLWVLPTLVLPLRLDPASLGKGTGIAPLPLREDGALQRLREDGPGFVDTLGPGLVMVEVLDRPFVRELVQALRERGELVARFTPAPEGDPGEKPFVPRDTHGEYPRDLCWLWRAFRVCRLGSVIEVYRVRERR